MTQAEIQRFYKLHGEELQKYLTLKVNCSQTAADLTQEVFLKLLNSNSLEQLENPRAYLYKIASNLVIDYFRKKHVKTTSIDENIVNLIQDDRPGPERTIIAQRKIEDLNEILRELPDRQREVLRMHKFEELSYSEIAQRLGISKNTVVAHMMRALNVCRAKLKDK